MTEQFIDAIVPWFGAKRLLAPVITNQFGFHRSYWEPFCGSLAVLLHKEPSTQESVNDLHGDLMNLARVIKHPYFGPWLYRNLRRMLVHEGQYWEAVDRLTDREFPVDGLSPLTKDLAERALDFFVASWLGRNGLVGTTKIGKSFCVRYTMNGGLQGTRFQGAIKSIPAWRRRLSKVTMLCRNAFDIIPRIDDAEGVLIYCDPPYIVKGAKYVHDFEELINFADETGTVKQINKHEYLAILLRRFKKARVVVSYYEDPRLDGLYPGWTKLSCHVTSSLANHGQRQSKGRPKEELKVAPEVILINGPELETADLLF